MSLPPREELFGHPKGLYVCFFTEMWERFSFYGMKALLALYLIKHHGFTDSQGLVVVGAFGGLSTAAPVLGGILADRFLGMRKAVTLGAILLCLGHFGMSVQGHAARVGPDGVLHRDQWALAIFYLSLASIIVGVGLLKPNITVMVGKLYGPGDIRRDAGFTLFYAGINIGVLFASLICGYLGEVFGWHYGFGAAGLGMAAGLAVFLTGQTYLGGRAEPPHPAALKRKLAGPLDLEWTIYLGTFLTLPVVWALIQLGTTVLWFQVAIMLAWLGWFGWYVTTRCTRVQRHRMLACVFFMAVCFPYFVLSGQAYGSWILFTDRMLDKDLIPALVIRDGHPLPWSIVPLVASPFLVAVAPRVREGRTAGVLAGGVGALAVIAILHDSLALPQTASSLTYLYALILVMLSPLMVWLWPFLKRHGHEPSRVHRSVIGVAFGGLAFLPLALAAEQAGLSGQASSVWWLVAAYLLLELGDVILSPATLSAVTELSMPQVVGLMMGARWLSTSLAAQFAASLGSLAAIDLPAGASFDWAPAASRYATLFWQMAALGLGMAALTLLVTPVIRRWAHEGM